jgi:hypothetical protein
MDTHPANQVIVNTPSAASVRNPMEFPIAKKAAAAAASASAHRENGIAAVALVCWLSMPQT